LDETIPAVGDPARQSVTKQRAILQQLVDDAVDGDLRAMALLLSLCARVLPRDSDPGPDEDSPEDAAIVKKFGS